MVTHVGDLDHKLVFTVFTEVLNQVRSRLIFSQTSTQSELLREISSLRHFNVGSTFQDRRLSPSRLSAPSHMQYLLHAAPSPEPPAHRPFGHFLLHPGLLCSLTFRYTEHVSEDEMSPL